jgi:hypothetical protein
MLCFGASFKKTHLVCHDFPSHFSEEIGGTTSPPMLLMTVGLEGTWEFTLDLLKICVVIMYGAIKQFSALKNNCLKLQAAKVRNIPLYHLHTRIPIP